MFDVRTTVTIVVFYLIVAAIVIAIVQYALHGHKQTLRQEAANRQLTHREIELQRRIEAARRKYNPPEGVYYDYNNR